MNILHTNENSFKTILVIKSALKLLNNTTTHYQIDNKTNQFIYYQIEIWYKNVTNRLTDLYQKHIPLYYRLPTDSHPVHFYYT